MREWIIVHRNDKREVIRSSEYPAYYTAGWRLVETESRFAQPVRRSFHDKD